jgi:hypothetical protein
MPMYNLPDVYSITTSTVPSTTNVQVDAACSVWLSVNTGPQSTCDWNLKKYIKSWSVDDMLFNYTFFSFKVNQYNESLQ